MTRASARFTRYLALFAVAAVVTAACGSGAAPTAAPASAAPTAAATAAPTAAPPPPPRRAPTAAAAPVEIEWFIGLGTGQNEEQVAAENKVVEEFNATHPNIKLKVTIVDNTEAADTLATRIGAGDAPDIIGPVGIRGLQQFGDQLLDLSPYLAGADLSEIEPSLISAFNVNGKQIGLPTGVYSSFIYYNKDLFKEAGVAEPPHEVGAQYEGKPWTWDTLAELAAKLTVDANGNDATSSDFDASKTVQFGFDAHMTENDVRAWSTEFGGSGSEVAADGTTRAVPRQLANRSQVLVRRGLDRGLDPRQARGRRDHRQRHRLEHVPVRPYGHGAGAPVVHLLHLSGRGRPRGQGLGPRRPAGRPRRQGDLEAPCRHHRHHGDLASIQPKHSRS